MHVVGWVNSCLLWAYHTSTYLSALHPALSFNHSQETLQIVQLIYPDSCPILRETFWKPGCKFMPAILQTLSETIRVWCLSIFSTHWSGSLTLTLKLCPLLCMSNCSWRSRSRSGVQRPAWGIFEHFPAPSILTFTKYIPAFLKMN